VKADSPYKTMKDLIDDAKKKPGQIRTGGTYAPGTDALISHMIEKAAGVKFNYIPFKSGGEAMVALLGGNLDMFYPNPERPGADGSQEGAHPGVASEKRLAGAPTSPPCGSWGSTRPSSRSAALPPPGPSGRSGPLLRKPLPQAGRFHVVEGKHPENMLTWDYKNSAEPAKLWDANNEFCARTMKEMGSSSEKRFWSFPEGSIRPPDVCPRKG
jgi:hypothetical protein